MLPLLPAKAPASREGISRVSTAFGSRGSPLPSTVLVRRAGSDEEMHPAVLLGEDTGHAYLQTPFRWRLETPLEIRSTEYLWLAVVCGNVVLGNQHEVVVRLQHCVPINLCLPLWH